MLTKIPIELFSYIDNLIIKFNWKKKKGKPARNNLIKEKQRGERLAYDI